MSLTVHTARISYGGPDRLDVTRKSGVAAFAPSWRILGPALRRRRDAAHVDEIEWHAYREAYLAEMRESYRMRRREWALLLARDRAVLCCYCTDPLRCHRRLLAGILAKLGATDAGEIHGDGYTHCPEHGSRLDGKGRCGNCTGVFSAFIDDPDPMS
jgi:uncharacterized protein YeaO (DUF488 family)